MSAIRIALQALFSLPLKTYPPVPPAYMEARPPSSLPLPPLSEGRGVAGEALGVSCACSRASSSPSSCAHSKGEGGGGGAQVALWLGAGLSQLIPPLRRAGGGGGSAAIPPFQPSPVLARSPPMSGPSGLLVCDSQLHSHSSGGLRRERTRSRSPRASRSSSGESRGERCRDRSHSVGSRVRTRVSRSRFTIRSQSRGRDCSRRSSSRSSSVRSRSRRH